MGRKRGKNTSWNIDVMLEYWTPVHSWRTSFACVVAESEALIFETLRLDIREPLENARRMLCGEAMLLLGDESEIEGLIESIKFSIQKLKFNKRKQFISAQRILARQSATEEDDRWETFGPAPNFLALPEAQQPLRFTFSWWTEKKRRR